MRPLSFARRRILRVAGRLPVRRPAGLLSGGWCWIQDPRAVHHHGEHDRTYFGWCDDTGLGRIMTAFFDHETGEVSQAVVSFCGQHDDHAAPALLMVEGRPWVFWSGHNSGGLRLRKARRPEDLGGWGWERRITPDRAVTYANPVMVSGGKHHRRVYVFYRDTTQPPGLARCVRMTWCDHPWRDGDWAAPVTLVNPDVRGEAASEAYFKVEAAGQAIHVACSSDDHNVWDTYRDIFWFCSEDGGETWKTHTSALELPVSLGTMEKVFSSWEHGGEEATSWIWDLALDGAGHPHMVFAHMLNQADNHEYRSVRWDGTQWIQTKICDDNHGGIYAPLPTYSGGVCLDHADPCTCYCSAAPAGGGLLEIREFRHNPSDRSWNLVKRVSPTGAFDNLRPVVPRDSRPPCRVMWMRGTYRGFTDYPTGIAWGEWERAATPTPEGRPGAPLSRGR